MSWVLITPKTNAKTAKKFLEEKGLYDKKSKMTKFSEEEVMIPLKQESAEQIKHEQTKGTDKSLVLSLDGRIQYTDLENVGQHKISPQERLKLAVGNLLQKEHVTLDDNLHEDLPSHWEQHGDLILLPEKSFTLDTWQQFGVELWQVVAKSLGAARLAKKSTIRSDGYRTPKVNLLYGDDSWVMHIDNGIKYTFDVTKCMFSAGNITEKIRVGKFNCKGQTVVDLYAGIGYFTLPYLVHSKAAMVYACEWNDNAIEALKRNLKLNGVDKQCVIFEGDNQKFPLRGVADHVNLGLIPSSEAGWPVACAALQADIGGWLHVHGNVTSQLTNSKERLATLPSIKHSFIPTEREDPRINSHQSSVNDKVSNTGQTSGGCDRSLCGMNQVPSCNRTVRPEWLSWAKYVAQSLLQLLEKSHDIENWSVQIQHIEHVKSYAPHVDHVVLDVECRPL